MRMRIPSRPSLSICVCLALIVSGARAFEIKEGKLLAAREERAILRNQYGAVVRDSDGQRINYSREQLKAQELQASGRELPVRPFISETSSGEAAWSYATFGSGIGLSNIIVAQNGAYPEIYSGGGFNSYWFALRYNSTKNDYDQVYVSPYFYSSISRINVANVVGDSANEIIVALQDGHVYLYDQATKTLVGAITTANGLAGLDVADLDGDGANELVLCSANHLYVYSGDGVLKWDLAGVGGNALVVAQMDADSALEIAATDGHVVDCATHSVQWTWSYGFGVRLAAADIDGDGMRELIVAEGWQFVWAYDVDRQLPKWSIQTPQDIGAIQVLDIDGDSAQELLVGDGQWGDVRAYDTVTQQQEWFVHNPEHGVTNIAVGDVDGDGDSELLWGAGASSSGEDHLYIANWQTRQITWQNIHLDGPFIGPEIGDLDGDGREEIVVISTSSDSGYSSGLILVFDAITRGLRAISGPTMGGLGWTGIHDLRLRDVNGDGKLEILVAASFTYDGVIEIYSFDATNTFTRTWINSTRPSNGSFYCVDAADIDNDGDMEIIGGAGGYLYVYSYATGNEEWHTLYLRGVPTALAIADANQDGTKEIIGMVNDSDVYIFDGSSRSLEAILTGPFTSMRVQNVTGVLSIVLGNSAGDLIMYSYSSGSYSETYRERLVTTSVDGFTIDSQDRVWIGTAESYGSPGTLKEVTLAGSILATYSGYGSAFGLRTAFVPASLMFFTTGSYSLVGFPTCSASLSATSQTFGSAGGTGSVAVTTTCDWAAISNVDWIIITSGGSGTGDGLLNYSVSANSGSSPRTGTMMIAGQTFTVNQTTGSATIGLYAPSGGAFFLRNSNSTGVADIAFTYGPAGLGFLPIVGDWNGDGADTIGLYNPTSGSFFLKNANSTGVADVSFAFGPAGAGWIPLVGDWDGNGVDTIGLYNPTSGTFFLKNSNSTGVADVSFAYGPSGAGWIPIVGDWDGNGTSTIGLYNPTAGTFFLRNTNSTGIANLSFAFGPGGAGWKPVIGDWNDDGTDTIGLYNPSASAFFLRNSNSSGVADVSFAYGPAGAGWTPLVGDWDGL
jgi:hypothetical protein